MPTYKSSRREQNVKFPTAVRRIRIRWARGKASLVKQVRVDRMTLPPSIEDRPDAPLLGDLAELLDEGGRVMYRVALTDLSENTVELFERGGRMTRVASRAGELLLDVLVPEMRGASKLLICRYTARYEDRQPRRSVLYEVPLGPLNSEGVE